MKSRNTASPLPAQPSREEDLATVSRTFHLETELAEWLDEQSRHHGASPSVLVSALLEWARDEDVLGADPLVVIPHANSRPTAKP
jgi:hypothetical protein